MEHFSILEIRLCQVTEMDIDGGINFHFFQDVLASGRFQRFHIDRNKFLLFHLLWPFWEVVIRGCFSVLKSLFSSFTLWLFKEVSTFRGFIHTETSIFRSLWPFREVVINGSFNSEWNLFEFFRLNYIHLRRWSLLEALNFYFLSHLGR